MRCGTQGGKRKGAHQLGNVCIFGNQAFVVGRIVLSFPYKKVVDKETNKYFFGMECGVGWPNTENYPNVLILGEKEWRESYLAHLKQPGNYLARFEEIITLSRPECVTESWIRDAHLTMTKMLARQEKHQIACLVDDTPLHPLHIGTFIPFLVNANSKNITLVLSTHPLHIGCCRHFSIVCTPNSQALINVAHLNHILRTSIAPWHGYTPTLFRGNSTTHHPVNYFFNNVGYPTTLIFHIPSTTVTFDLASNSLFVFLCIGVKILPLDILDMIKTKVDKWARDFLVT
jgi:hypothetical protein